MDACTAGQAYKKARPASSQAPR